MIAHSTHEPDVFVAATHTAQLWLDTVAAQLGTQDRHYAYRVLRAWLHIVRDRLGVDTAAHFAAQLPLLLRGVFFDGWTPSRVPVKYDAEQFLVTMAQEAKIARPEAQRAAAAVTAALARRSSPGQLEHLLAQLPHPIRELLEPGAAEAASPSEQPSGQPTAFHRPTSVTAGGPQARVERIDMQIGVVIDTLRALLHGLQEHPSDLPQPERAAAAARRAHQILLTLGPLGD